MSLTISWNTQTTALVEGDLIARSYEHTLAFDCVTSITVEGVSTLTKHAVESGAPISDHKRADPRTVTIEAIVSNTPLDVPPPSGYGNSNDVTTSLEKEGKGAVIVFSREFDRIQDVIETLDRLRLESTPVTLSTGRRTFDEVQIVQVTEPFEVEDGDSQRFTIAIQEVRIAQSRTVETPRPREPRGASRTDRGGQEGESAADQRVSTIQAAREDYAARREAGESPTDAALGSLGTAFGGG